MTKEEKIAIQKKEMTSFMNYFRDNQLDFNDTELLQKMQDSITRIFQLEIEELGYSYQPNRDDSQNTFGLKFINDRSETFLGVYRKNTRPPSITYNIAHLYRGLQSQMLIKDYLLVRHYIKRYFMKYNIIDKN